MFNIIELSDYPTITTFALENPFLFLFLLVILNIAVIYLINYFIFKKKEK